MSSGQLNTCALRIDGSVVCWGLNSFGQGNPPAGSFEAVAAGYVHACGIASGRLECWGANLNGQQLAPDGTDFYQLSAGYNHSCVIRQGGSVSCWGENTYGQSSPPSSGGTITIPPTATFIVPESMVEGSEFSISLEDAQVPGYDGEVSFSYAFDCGQGAGYSPFAESSTASCQGADDGVYEVKGIVRDQDGDWTEYVDAVSVLNAPPVFTVVELTPDAVPVESPVSLSASFADPGEYDSWTVEIDWGDGTPPQTMGGLSGTQEVDASHVYSNVGSYIVSLSVSDDDGGRGTAHVDDIVVFDPEKGSMTAAGWMHSPAGAYLADPGLQGRLEFRVVSRYRARSTYPTGVLRVRLTLAGLDLEARALSTS